MEQSFSVHWRNPGHWDVSNRDMRIFRIRGEGSEVWVSDERSTKATPVINFKSVQTAMAWITDELMAERVTETVYR